MATPQPGHGASPMPAPPASGHGHGGWEARASKRAGFATLIGVEFRKLAGTLSDKIVLVVGPVIVLVLTVLIVNSIDDMTTATNQISPLVILVRFAHVVLHAAVIKLVAGEWQYRSVQPTLLVQPSRVRYALAQAVVVFTVWVASVLLQLLPYFPLVQSRADAVGHGYLLDLRVGWVIAVAVLGTALTMAVAMAIAMLLPNSTAAMTVYFLAVPTLLILGAAMPGFVSWVDPVQPMMVVAGIGEVTSIGSVITSSLLIVTLLGLGVWRVARRDAG